MGGTFRGRAALRPRRGVCGQRPRGRRVQGSRARVLPGGTPYDRAHGGGHRCGSPAASDGLDHEQRCARFGNERLNLIAVVTETPFDFAGRAVAERQHNRARRRGCGCRAAVRGSGRRAASPSADRDQPPLAISGEREAGPDVLARQVREVPEQIVLGHARRQVVEHVGDRYPQATDARLAAAFSRLDGDPIQARHGLSLRNDQPWVKQRPGTRNRRCRTHARLQPQVCRTRCCRRARYSLPMLGVCSRFRDPGLAGQPPK